MKIANKIIKKGNTPFIIAEVSGNHNGDIERAIKIIKAAKQAGADAVKLQTYTADTMTIDHDSPEFLVDLPLWKGRSLYDIYEEAHTPWEWHKKLFDTGKEQDIIVFSSPFDASAVDFLEDLNTPLYKIASFELVDIPLIQKVASTGKPMIISTGMGTLEEIERAVIAASDAGCPELALLHCVSSYPAPINETNLTNIPALQNRFKSVVGISDHTLGIKVAMVAVAMGALIIEKHFTLSRSEGGIDHAFSIEPGELKKMVRDVQDVTKMLNPPEFGPKESEKKSLAYRRSLYAVADISKGESFTESNVRSIRPALGIEPRHIVKVLNHVASRNISRGEPISLDMLG